LSLKKAQESLKDICFNESFSNDDPFIKSQSPIKQSIYRHLVFDNIHAVICAAMPLTEKHYGEDKFKELVQNFVYNIKIQSPYYRDIPKEFLSFISFKGILNDLSHDELTEFDMAFWSDATNIPTHNSDAQLLDAKLYLNPVISLNKYDYPIHKVDNETILEEIKPNVTFRLLYRNLEQNTIHKVLLNEVSYKFLRHAMCDKDLNFSMILDKLMDEFKTVDQEKIATQAVGFLKELIDKKIVLSLL